MQNEYKTLYEIKIFNLHCKEYHLLISIDNTCYMHKL